MLPKMSNLLFSSVKGVVSCTNWSERHLGHRDVVSDLRHGIASEEQLKLDLGVVHSEALISELKLSEVATALSTMHDCQHVPVQSTLEKTAAWTTAVKDARFSLLKDRFRALKSVLTTSRNCASR